MSKLRQAELFGKGKQSLMLLGVKANGR